MVSDMSSDNPFGADNQQETGSAQLDPMWVVGFVDGEGCFSVSVHRNALPVEPAAGTAARVPGKSHEDHVGVLEELAPSSVAGGCVGRAPVGLGIRRCKDSSRERIIPFFEQYELKVKGDDFMAFAAIVSVARSEGAQSS